MLSRNEFIQSVISLAMGSYAALANKIFAADKGPRMKNLYHSSEKVGVIGLGTYKGFDIQNDVHDRAQLSGVLKILFEHRLSVIDSSPMYGRAEEVTGQLLELKQKQAAFIATKIWTTGKVQGIKQIEDSERFFGRKIDLMQIHNLQDYKTHLTTLRSMKEQGRIRYWGITHYVTSAFDRMMTIMKTDKPDFIQIPYSAILRDAEKKILPLASERQINVLINRPFEGGDLFATLRKKDYAHESAKWNFPAEVKSWAQLLLLYIISNPAVTCAIPGTGNPRHMLDNAQAAFLPPLSQKQKENVISYLKSL